MFPPEKTDDLETMLAHLYESLSRASDHFTNEGHAQSTPDGQVVTLRLKLAIPQDGRRAMVAYIRGYARECGWELKNIRVEGLQVRFLARALGPSPRKT